ncbi:hypothetical protein SAMN04487996_109108 [Dyadobacter soli]|uniref:Uncharacterized protein n=1 Tax=Dyadobacter soli TaxID=659014 RepID=A0A1G7IVN5_9BACT|nr:hypothetical protein [Dyadobacter soli]SDF16656.1 hypothetical protein SAMN04487996_109108 [Dyadobacter soli]
METVINQKAKSEQWFDDIVAQIRADQLAYEAGIISPEEAVMYDNLMNGEVKPLIDNALAIARMYYVKRMLFDYVKVLGGFHAFSKLAVSFHDSGLLVWTEIPDGREDIEDKLIMAEAEVNSKYHPFGFNISTTYVEECDKLPIPSYYQLLAHSKTA